VRKRVGHIEIDTIAAERSKFTAPIVFVHGLWCTSSVWHRLMGSLAHRGWDCHAVNLRGRSSSGVQPLPSSSAQANIAAHLADLNAVIAACESPPVVVGHDLGGLLALSSSLASARANVAFSPLLPPSWRSTPLPGFTGLRARIALRWRDRLPPPRGQALRHFFGPIAPQSIVPETAALAHDLGDPTLSFPVGTAAPTLILIGEADPVTSVPAATRLAATVGAEVQRVAGGGHALPWESSWQERGTELHRWLIRTLGDSLLAMLDEEEDE
jgi:pimeloyl-ACP methyl ester carboxylesterase